MPSPAFAVLNFPCDRILSTHDTREAAEAATGYGEFVYELSAEESRNLAQLAYYNQIGA